MAVVMVEVRGRGMRRRPIGGVRKVPVGGSVLRGPPLQGAKSGVGLLGVVTELMITDRQCSVDLAD